MTSVISFFTDENSLNVNTLAITRPRRRLIGGNDYVPLPPHRTNDPLF